MENTSNELCNNIDYAREFITTAIGIIAGFVTYFVTRKLDKWEHNRNYSKLGIVIIDSLLEEVRIGLDIIKNKQNSPLPSKSWNEMETIPNEVMLIILAVSNGVKAKTFHPKDIRSYCKNYFKHITQNWQNNPSMAYQKPTEEVIEMLEQTKFLLEKNSKKCFPK